MLCCGGQKKPKAKQDIQQELQHENPQEQQKQQGEQLEKQEGVITREPHDQEQFEQRESFADTFIFDINDEEKWPTQFVDKQIDFKHIVKNIEKFHNPLVKVVSLLEEKKEQIEDNQDKESPKSVQDDFKLTPLSYGSNSKGSIYSGNQFQVPLLLRKVVSQPQQIFASEFTKQNALNGNEIIYLYYKNRPKYSICQTKEQMLEMASKFVPIKFHQHSRIQYANKEGGKECRHKSLVKNIRALVNSLIKDVGKQYTKSNSNLQIYQIPIKYLVPESGLECILRSTNMFPYYINKAAEISSEVERFKLVIVAVISSFSLNYQFFIPMIPHLGETIQGQYDDGTLLYAEQISQNCSAYFVQGLNYTAWGDYRIQITAGLNQLELINKGKRSIKFLDGQTIQYNFSSDFCSGLLWNPLKIEAKGSLTFVDLQNQISSVIEFGNVRQKPTDYFQTEILRGNKNICKIYGSYMGFINFDDRRYWDHSWLLPYKLSILESDLQSDFHYRKDRQLYLETKIKEAQQTFDELNQIQQQDKLLRLEHLKYIKLQQKIL